MKFSEFILPDAILVSLQSPDRDGVIRELATAVGNAGGMSPEAIDEVVEGLQSRERSGTTGFGRGVAAPHCKCSQVPRLVGGVGISLRGVDFKALDGKPVYIVFLLLSPQGQDQAHLRAMEVVFRNLNKDTFRKFLRAADTRGRVLELLNEADEGK
jgi:mannitol/fructose-specific phosphotransferase system IIA component (Ntr-type)